MWPKAQEKILNITNYESKNVSHLVMFSSLQLQGLWPSRLLCPWDSLGKDTGVGCHFLSRASSWHRDRFWVSCIVGGFFTNWATREWEKCKSHLSLTGASCGFSRSAAPLCVFSRGTMGYSGSLLCGTLLSLLFLSMEQAGRHIPKQHIRTPGDG